MKGIAERRTDIFGVGGEEAEIGKKVKFKVIILADQCKNTLLSRFKDGLSTVAEQAWVALRQRSLFFRITFITK